MSLLLNIFFLLGSVSLINSAYAASMDSMSQEDYQYIESLGDVNIAVLSEKGQPVYPTSGRGEFYNLNVTYMKKIANELGLKIEFVEFENTEQVMSALYANEADLILDFNEKAIKDKQGLFYSAPIFKSSVAYWSNSYVDQENLETRPWVCVSGTVYCNILDSRGIENVTRVANFRQGTESVIKSGNKIFIDSYISFAEYLNATDNVSSSISTPPWGGFVYAQIVSLDENKRLVEIINKIIKRSIESDHLINSTSPYYFSDMINRAFRNSNYSNLIKYSFDDDSFPLLFRNQDGSLSGYLKDILDLISSRTMLEFEYVPLRQSVSVYDMLASNEIDLVPYSSITVGSNESIEFTDAFMSFTYYTVSLAYSAGQKKESKGVLLSEGKKHIDVKNPLFGENTKVFKDSKKILRALETGEIDIAYIREDIIEIIISSHADDEYFVDRTKPIVVNLAMAVSSDKLSLINVLNSIFRTWDQNELNKIKNSYDPFNVVYGYEEKYLYQVTFGFVFVFLFSVVIFYLLQKNMKLNVIIKEKDAAATRIENEFLNSVIRQIPSIVFIYDGRSNIRYTNCSKYLSNQCNACHISESGMCYKNKKVFDDMFHNDLTINDVCRTYNCPLDMEMMEYVCKKITLNDKEYILTVINDITEKNQRENDLKNAKKKAESAIQARDKFLASMTHELRTPIAGMVGLIEMLGAKIEDEEETLLINNISSSARQLNVLVNDILDFSKLEADQLKLSPFDCDVLRETSEVLRVHKIAADKKGIRLHYNFKPTNVRLVSIDGLRYSQILNNLLSNAIKFTDIGTVTLEVELSDTSINFLVTDTGCGMSTTVLATVFSPFVQADSSIARKYGGTGLGLSIVSELVELMNGQLNVESIENLGTKMSVSLPHQLVSTYKGQLSSLDIQFGDVSDNIKEWVAIWSTLTGYRELEIPDKGHSILITSDYSNVDSEIPFERRIVFKDGVEGFKQVEQQQIVLSNSPIFPDLLFECLYQHTDKASTLTPLRFEQLQGTVLVAEDNPINQLVIRKQLEQLGLTVNMVDDGEAAYHAIMEHPNGFDLLITDCHMPNMDGFELSSKLRNEANLDKHLTIIGCTAEDSSIVRSKSNESGFDHILFKPYGIEKLRNLLEACLLDNGTKIAPITHWLDKYNEEEVEQLRKISVACLSSDLKLLEEQQEDLPALQKTVHKIKGGALSLGIDDLAKIIYKVERSIKAGRKVELKSQLEILADVMQKNIALIENYQRSKK